MENCHFSTHMAFWKESMINRLSNLINRNRSAAKISQVLCSSGHACLIVYYVVRLCQNYWDINCVGSLETRKDDKHALGNKSGRPGDPGLEKTTHSAAVLQCCRGRILSFCALLRPIICGQALWGPTLYVFNLTFKVARKTLTPYVRQLICWIILDT